MLGTPGMQTKYFLYDPFAADVFSLGMMFLQMIKYKNIKNLRQEIDNKTVKMEGIDEELWEIITKMLESNPKKRISFQEVLEKLKSIKIKKERKNDEQEFIKKFKENIQTKPKKLFKNKLKQFIIYYFDFKMKTDYVQILEELRQILENNQTDFENTKEKAIYLKFRAKALLSDKEEKKSLLDSLKIFQHLGDENNLDLVSGLQEFEYEKNFLLKSYNICLYLKKKQAALKSLFLLGYYHLSNKKKEKCEKDFLKFFKLARELLPKDFNFEFSMKTFDDCFVKLGDMLTIEQNLLNEKANLFGHTDGSLSAILDKIGKYYEKNEEYSQAIKF